MRKGDLLMRKKVLTKDCPSCKLMVINDNSNFTCTWGTAKKAKILNDPVKGVKPCNLRKENE